MTRRGESLAPFLVHLRTQLWTVLLAMLLALTVSACNLVVPLLFKAFYEVVQKQGAAQFA
ncbi:MAG: hypothetical protein HYU66_26370, partial [Armatimonadetes bacterium]|nr:hypothetical protein [Armatimonadota bacterium]